jgi:hypothetical protein
MNNFKFKPSGLVFNALMALLITASFSGTIVDAGIVFTGLTALSFLPMPNGVTLMAVTREIWTKDIVDNLFKDNAFAQRAFNADMYVILGKVVHIPVAGTPSVVSKNVNAFPVSAVKRTDTDINYNLDTFYTTPRQIEKIEEFELEYDKRQSVLGEDQNALREAAIEALIYNWLPLVANTVMTDGGARAATISGGTANVKKFTKASFEAIKLSMDKANIPAAGRVCVMTATHYNDFLASLTDAERTDIGRVADLKTGLIGRFLGIEIYMRSTVGRYRGADGAYVKVDEQDAAFAASDKTSDRAASLFWHESCVERALGEINIFDEPVRADYYGAIVSMILRLGGRIRRTTGVWAAVEALA